MNNNRKLDKGELREKYSTDELIGYLHCIVDSEIKKSDKMDADLIGECVDWVLELKGIKVELTEEEVKKRVKTITERHYAKKQRKLRFLCAAAIAVAWCLAYILSKGKAAVIVPIVAYYLSYCLIAYMI